MSGHQIIMWYNTSCFLNDSLNLHDDFEYLKPFFPQSNALLSRVESTTSTDERKMLHQISQTDKLKSTLLPIKSVGVQVRWIF